MLKSVGNSWFESSEKMSVKRLYRARWRPMTFPNLISSLTGLISLWQKQGGGYSLSLIFNYKNDVVLKLYAVYKHGH